MRRIHVLRSTSQHKVSCAESSRLVEVDASRMDLAILVPASGGYRDTLRLRPVHSMSAPTSIALSRSLILAPPHTIWTPFSALPLSCIKLNTPSGPSLSTTPFFKLKCFSIASLLLPCSRNVKICLMVYTSKNSLLFSLPRIPVSAISASALFANSDRAESTRTAGFVRGSG